MIDWLRVEMVCNGTALKLEPDERRMVIRRLSDRMQKLDDWFGDPRKLSCSEVARRLGVTERSVLRYANDLPAADKQVCQVCHEPMWVIDGVVEPHPDRIFEECPMSGQQMRRGLAATRPDLYQWLEEVS